MAGGSPLPPRLFNVLALPTLAALILAIVAGTNANSSKPSDIHDGHTEAKAAVLIFLITFLIQCAIALYSFLSLHSISQGEKRILFAVTLSIPFLLVRLIYAILVNFDTGSTTFNYTTGSVIVQAFMAIIEEFIVVTLYLIAGVLAPKILRSEVQPSPEKSNFSMVS